MGESRNLSVDMEGFVQHLNCRLFHLATVCTSSRGWLGLSGQSLGHYHCWSPSSTTCGQSSSQGVTSASKPFRFQLIFGTWQRPHYIEGYLTGQRGGTCAPDWCKYIHYARGIFKEKMMGSLFINFPAGHLIKLVTNVPWRLDRSPHYTVLICNAALFHVLQIIVKMEWDYKWSLFSIRKHYIPMLIYLEIGQLTYATTNNKMHLDGPPVFSRFLMEDNKGIGSFLFCSCKDGTCLLFQTLV